MFWVDEITNEILEKTDKKEYLVTDWKTPSGHVHIGSLRGVAIHDAIKRGLVDLKKEAVFQYGFDDYDPMDGLPIYIDQTYEKYMGMPLCNVPAPDGVSESYADQYSNEFKTVFNGLGIEPVIVKTSDMYRSGKFNDSIKIVLENANIIRDIYKKISGSDKEQDWYPLQVICPECGKLGTTKVTGWNGKEVDFTCEESLVTWAKGCGYKGKISPFDGNGKLPWKVEWPSKWLITNTDIEGEGKDHSAASGSREVADNIYRDVFKKVPPFDIPYEFFLIGGAKMSSSKGLGASAKDIFDFLPENILRFLCLRTKYKRAIDFQPEGEAIPVLYDEYDRCAQEYEKDPKSDLGRAFYFAEIDNTNPPAGGQPEYLLRFSKIAYMLQMPKVDIYEYAEKEKQAPLTDIEKQEIENRVAIAKKWLEKFAPENYKFTILDTLPESAKSLSALQKEFLHKISAIIKTKDNWAGEDLHQEIHQIKKDSGIEPREAFSAIYQVFIGKDSGPQAGWLLESLDKEFVVKRLEEL